MKTKAITSRQYFKKLITVYYVSLISLALFVITTGVFFVMEEERIDKIKPVAKIFYVLMPLLAIIGYFCNKIVFKRDLDKLQYKDDLTEKMRGYRSALILKYAFLIIPSLAATVISLITREETFLSLSILLILLLFVDKPSPVRAAKDLALQSSDAQTINNPDKIIA
ncbi:MAG: hypothetical protein LBG80_02920 [Bacteroidales bacterium]|jgi:hypothetical protein|nr:hypothetical protein [Bacteroidales bacterium]